MPKTIQYKTVKSTSRMSTVVPLGIFPEGRNKKQKIARIVMA